MCTPEEGSHGPRSNHPRYVLRYTLNGEGDKFAEGVARRGTRSFGAEVCAEARGGLRPLAPRHPDHAGGQRDGRVRTSPADGELISQSDPPRKPRPVEIESKAEVKFDRARHVIKITHEGGKTAEFEERPIRFLVLDRNPVTKALEPVIIRGEPLYYYLAWEVGGDK